MYNNYENVYLHNNILFMIGFVGNVFEMIWVFSMFSLQTNTTNRSMEIYSIKYRKRQKS